MYKNYINVVRHKYITQIINFNRKPETNTLSFLPDVGSVGTGITIARALARGFGTVVKR